MRPGSICFLVTCNVFDIGNETFNCYTTFKGIENSKLSTALQKGQHLTNNNFIYRIKMITLSTMLLRIVMFAALTTILSTPIIVDDSKLAALSTFTTADNDQVKAYLEHVFVSYTIGDWRVSVVISCVKSGNSDLDYYLLCASTQNMEDFSQMYANEGCFESYGDIPSINDVNRVNTCALLRTIGSLVLSTFLPTYENPYANDDNNNNNPPFPPWAGPGIINFDFDVKERVHTRARVIHHRKYLQQQCDGSKAELEKENSERKKKLAKAAPTLEMKDLWVLAYTFLNGCKAFENVPNASSFYLNELISLILACIGGKIVVAVLLGCLLPTTPVELTTCMFDSSKHIMGSFLLHIFFPGLQEFVNNSFISQVSKLYCMCTIFMQIAVVDLLKSN